MITKDMVLESAKDKPTKIKDMEKWMQSDARKMIKQMPDDKILLWKAEDGNMSNVMHSIKKDDPTEITRLKKDGFVQLIK